MKFKRCLSLILATCVIFSCTSVFGVVASAAENTSAEKVLFKETFNNTFDDSSYWDQHNATFSNDEMVISGECYPSLRLCDIFRKNDYDSKKSYEISYKVKFEWSEGSAFSWKCYDYYCTGFNAIGASIGTDKNFFGMVNGVADKNNGTDRTAKDSVKNGKWYTLKTEFCLDASQKYVKRTVVDENGVEIYSRSENGIRSYDLQDKLVDFATPEDFGNTFYFWVNVTTNTGTAKATVDDVCVKEVTPVYSENFNNIVKADLQYKGFSRITDTVDLEEGALSFAPGAYVYFDIFNKNQNTVYELKYDIMAKNGGGTKGGLNFYTGDTDPVSLGMFNSNNGFATRRYVYSSGNTITGTVAGKWYTVVVEFCENADNNFISYTLIDKETSDELGNYTYSTLERQTGTLAATGNHTNFCLWNRQDDIGVNEPTTGETYLIDNISLRPIDEEVSTILLNENFDEKSFSGTKIEGTAFRDLDGIGAISDNTLELGKGAYIYFDIPAKTSKTDSYRLTYDVKVTGETTTSGGEGSLTIVSDGNPGYLLGSFNPLIGLVGNKTPSAEKTDRLIPVTDGNDKWYTVTAEFCENPATSFMRYTLTERESGTVLGTYLCPYLENTNSLGEIEAYPTSYYLWNRGGNETKVYVDNFKFEKIITPSVYFNDIKVTDYAGTASAIKNKLTPDVKNISVNFTAGMDATSANSKITLKESDGAAVDATYAISGKSVVITPKAMLKPETEYQISVADGIVSSHGAKTKGGATVDFVTTAVVRVGGVDLSISKLNDISANAEFTVTGVVANTENTEATAYVIVAFYAKGELKNIQPQAIAMSANSAKNINATFTAPADMTGIDSMKVFLWSDLDSIKPCMENITIVPGTNE